MFQLDTDLGSHQGKRRQLVWEISDLGVVAENILAAGSFTSFDLYAPCFVHFTGVLATTTPLATTLNVSIQPRPQASGLFADELFLVAGIATVASASPRRYPFYWGAARGAITSAAGATLCFASVFRIVIENAGAQPANATSLEGLEAT